MVAPLCAKYVVLQLSIALWTSAASSDLPCLCLFDVDRTLTGKQNDLHHCTNNMVIPDIHDPGFGGGPLTISQLAQNLDQTFCVNCYAGIITAGSAGGQDMRSRLVVLLNNKKQQVLQVADTWHRPKSDDSVDGPLVYDVHKGHKHHVAARIREWYLKQMKVHIQETHTHFFDDDARNLVSFAKYQGYQASQVSCASRDNTRDDLVGWCGAVVAEIVPLSGTHSCSISSRRRRAFTSDMPTSPEDTGVVTAEMLAEVEGSREELSGEDGDLFKSRWTCAGQRRRHFKPHMHVYRMRFHGEPKGVKDRNAASLNGIMELMTGGSTSLPKSQRVGVAWGLNRYYNSKGVMELTYISYTRFGRYQSCNAAQPGVPGSPHRCTDCQRPSSQCCCSSSNATSPLWGDVLPGVLSNSYTGGEWYSFNGEGYGKTWHQFECPGVTVKMTTLVDKLSEVGKCGKCSADHDKCAACLRKISTATRERVFHELLHITSSGMDESLFV